MCFSAPKMPTPPVPAQFQPALQPQNLVATNAAGQQSRRRGLYSAIFTSPAGVSGAPVVTGSSGGLTGG